MATRESQGLQIAFILTAMLTVVLGITTFYFFGQQEKYRQSEEASKTAEQGALQRLELEQFKVMYFRHIFGDKMLSDAELGQVVPSIEGDEEMAPIHQGYQQDMLTYGEGLPPEEQNYRSLPNHLILAYRGKNVANGTLSLEIESLKGEKKQLIAEKKQGIDAAEQNYRTKKGEYEAAMTEYDAARQKLQTDQQTQLTNYTSTIQARDVEIQTKKKELGAKDNQIGRLNETVKRARDRIKEFEDQPFEVPDGRVSWVNQETRTCWVNLGLADGLRRQVTFSVYDEEAMNLAPTGGGKKKTKKGEEEKSERKVDLRKAKIEITRVIDQHLSEARIIEDYAADPILPGDIVFSPAWKPGRRVRFALIPSFDIDGDGRSDADLVRNIITMSGGVIDAEVFEDGETSGDVTSLTRYLVIGAEPQNLRSNAKMVDARGALMTKARTLGIQEITLNLLLDLMGYKAEVRTVGLGRNVNPQQFKPEAPEGRMRSSVQNIFKERNPPRRRKTGSAY